VGLVRAADAGEEGLEGFGFYIFFHAYSIVRNFFNS
jgi:hypothetical protein